MSHDIEHERTFLARSLPSGLHECEKMEIVDVFLPTASFHPVLRLRKRGEKYRITKKYPVEEGDSSVMHEFTIPLDKEEYEELFQSVKGKRFRKIRHYLKEGDVTYEIDIYQDNLHGLVVVDVEFPEGTGKEEMVMPSWCLADVTQEEFVAGGMLCGKRYEDIAPQLEKFGYKRLSSKEEK
jgi:adenylate cyclase